MESLSENEFQRRLVVLNARIQNVNLAITDMLKEVDMLLRAYSDRVAALEKENAELRGENKTHECT